MTHIAPPHVRRHLLRPQRSNLLCLAAASALAGEELILVRDGKSDYVIVIPDKPTPVKRTAARELREHLAAVTGATLPVVSEADATQDAPRVILGCGPLARRLLHESLAG